MATSKFEPTYARQAYPCFDEPNMKANFTVHLLKPKETTYIALSNMPAQREEDVEDGVMVHFQESVRMSTYLTCFIVSDFTFTEDTLANGQQFRVYATPEQVSKTEYARVIGKSVIEYFIDYFGIDFPLPKLDMAAIPDFVSGAMEHWGLVTFRETALLYSTEISSSSNKQRVATVVSHELAHSWFGNLVTMDWWNDIWLNEGFATYIEYKGVDYAEPTWQMMDQFIIADLHPVLILDATLASHPIVQTVLTPDEITAIFDTISYNKGAAILRMLEDAVGQENFKAGVTKYLKDHEFGNAVTQDLWNALQEIVLDDINITELMNTWTMQMGYPVIDVTSDGEDNYILKQRRYLTNSDAIDETVTPYSYKWMIPVTYITSDSSIPQYVWFNYTEDQVTIPKPDADWIKFNYNQVGYYRVNYETNDWERLTQHIATLSIADRAHLLEEVFRLAHSNDITYAVALNLSKYMKDETDFIPWNVMSTMMHELNIYLATSSVYPDFKIFVQEMVTNAYNTLTWEEDINDGHVKSRARMAVLNLACAMDHQGCLDQAIQRFQEWLENSQALSQDLRAIIYNYDKPTRIFTNASGSRSESAIDYVATNLPVSGLMCPSVEPNLGDHLAQILDVNLGQADECDHDSVHLAEVRNIGVAGGTTANWEKLYDIFVQENDASEKLKLMHALTHSNDQTLLERLIDIAKTEDVVRGQDYFTLMQYIADNPVGTSIVWDYVREHWQDLVNRFGLNERYLGRMIPAITKTFTTTARLEEMQNFFSEYPDAGAGAAARLQALETVQNNIKWLQNNKEVVEDWISNYVNQS
ncbi:protease m1 zinc metalloprotease [Holotrichia oblita]|uniref:Protease m1 zinc metalloprotease n=1 Tax=Holotrichia oblita TaxID=644536 RepID=A0ACB9SXV2_HOLOL|nr:protease m1 zinc metalloprotease [Holotrichia oblita]